MAKKDIKRIFLGVVLIILAVISAAAAFYFLETKPQIWGDKLSAAKRGSPPARARTQTGPPAQAQADREGGAAASLDRGEPSLEEGAVVYEKKNQKHKEGFLWVDHKSSQYVLTLGRRHGLETGRQVGVYDGLSRVGEVTVDQAFEGTSYVHPSQESLDLSGSDYYRAVAE